MGKRISDEERIEQFFIRNTQATCVLMRDRVDLQMRTRFPDLAPAKRGRKPRVKNKPPISADPLAASESAVEVSASAAGASSAPTDRMKRPVTLAAKEKENG